jgi:hypothetical protein
MKLDPLAIVLFKVRKRTNSLVPVRAKSLATFAKGDVMQFVYGADFSGLNSRSGGSSMSTNILSNLGLGLRGLYQDLTEEPVPEFLSLFIRELEQREQSAIR